MKYTTDTGIGYFVDSDGDVVDYYDVEPGEHEAGGVRVEAIDVSDRSGLPEIAKRHRFRSEPPPQKRVAGKYREAKSDRERMDALFEMITGEPP